MDGLVGIKERDGWIAKQVRPVGESLPKEIANVHTQHVDPQSLCVPQQRTARKDQRAFLGKNKSTNRFRINRLGGQQFGWG